MSARDLFPHLLPSIDDLSDEENVALMGGVLIRILKKLRGTHSERCHGEILDALISPHFAIFAHAATMLVGDSMHRDLDGLRAYIRREAQLARAAGLVIPDGQTRNRKPRDNGDDLTGDLFGGLV
jgi:hypothetical protein